MLHHVELYVSDLNKTYDVWGWFLESLGYQKFQEWNHGVSWKSGTTYIVFVQVKDKYKKEKFHRCHIGLNHLAFQTSSKNQIDEITKELEKRGLNILYKDQHPHAGGKETYSVFFEDPDRIKVELRLK